MERSFTLPVTIAAAIHAALLFGFPRSTPHAVRRPATEILTPIFLGAIEEQPPPVDVAPPDPDASARVERPSSIEYPPVTRPGPRDFIIDSPPHPAVEVPGPVTIIPPSDGNRKAGPTGPVVRWTDLDNAPRARYQAPAVYPFDAKKAGLTGNVLVEFTVDEAGRVLEPVVIESSDRVFEDSTLRAVAKWRFDPGTRAGRVVRFRMRLPVAFTLSEDR